MTRLTLDDIARLPERLPQIGEGFVGATGQSLDALARWGAAGGPPGGIAGPDQGGRRAQRDSYVSGLRVAAIPVSSGLGFIPTFAEAVAAICLFIGCDAFVTDKPDVAGLAAAAERQARLVLLADDERFICLDLRSGGLADNGEATGRGYAAALAAAAFHLNGTRPEPPGAPEPGASRPSNKPAPVLVLGLGPVGRAAAAWLAGAGFRVLAFDPAAERRRWACEQPGLLMVGSLHEGLAQADLLVDASSAASFIGPELLSERTIIAAPGMPLGVTPTAANRLGVRLLHEPLALGVATMLHLAVLELPMAKGDHVG